MSVATISRSWVGRRKEPILGYIPKNYQKRIQAVIKGLIFVIDPDEYIIWLIALRKRD